MRGKSRIQASCLIMIHDSVILIRCNNPCKPTARGVSPKAYKAPGPFPLPGCYSNRKRSHHEPVDRRRICMELVLGFQAHPSRMSSVFMTISRLFFSFFRSENAQRVSAGWSYMFMLPFCSDLVHNICTCVNFYIYTPRSTVSMFLLRPCL